MYNIKSKNNLPIIPQCKEQNKKVERFECELVRSDSYIETLEIKPIELQGYGLELLIKTQLLTAKNPNETHYKSRTCIDRSNLIELRAVIEKLIRTTASSFNEPVL